MCLYIYIYSEQKISKKYIEARLRNYCHIEYSLSEVKLLELSSGHCEFFAVFSKDTVFYRDNEQYSISEGSQQFSAIQGFCWNKNDGNKTRVISIKDVQKRLIEPNVNYRLIQHDLSGEYSFFVRNKEGKVVSFNDNFGIENISYYEDKELFVLSNREEFVKIGASLSNYNYSVLCQFPLVGYRLLDEGVIESIMKLPPGGVLTFSPDKWLDIKKEHPVYLRKEEMSFITRGKRFEDLIEASIEEVKSNLFAVVNSGNTIPLGLTGGKDSRLTLAFCDYFGLNDSIDAFTNGHQKHPDVEVAKKIADIYGLNHRVNSPAFSTTSIPYVSANELFHRMAVHVFRTDASFGLWDLKSRGNSGYGLALSGFLGEVFKSYLKKPLNSSDKLSPKEFITFFDPLNIVDKEVKNEIDAKLKDKLWAFKELGYELSDIPDLYYAVVRVPQWLGAARLVDGYSIQSVSIVNSLSLSQLAMNLPSDERRMDIIHYELIKILSPRLLKIPFAMQSWDQNLEKFGAIPEVFSSPVTPRGNIPWAGSWQFSLNENPFFRKIIIEFVEATKQSQLWEYIDREKLLVLLKDKVFSTFELVSVYGLVTALMRESDYILPEKFGVYNTTDYKQPVFINEKSTGDLFVLNNSKLNACDAPTEITRNIAIPVEKKCLDLVFRGGKNKSKLLKKTKWLDIVKNKLYGVNDFDSLSFNGCLEVKTKLEISGWVYCNEFPEAKLTLDVYSKDILICQITADKIKESSDIKAVKHFFYYKFNGSVAEKADDIRVEIAGANVIL